MSEAQARRRRAVVRRRNQVTLPREVADALRIREGDEFEDAESMFDTLENEEH